MPDQAGGEKVNCHEYQDLMLPYLCSASDALEWSEVRSHLASGCPSCWGMLTEMQMVVALLGLSLPPVEPPDTARDFLLQKVAGAFR